MLVGEEAEYNRTRVKVKKEEDDDGEEKSRGEETRKVYGVKCQSASPSKHNYDRREEEEEEEGRL